MLGQRIGRVEFCAHHARGGADEENVLPSQPIFRFAPSPNGYLHLGHAYSALFTKRAAQAVGGTTLLRIEDIDIARCKPEYDAAILADLRWLDYRWPEPVLRQSERFAEYEKAAQKLRTSALLYPCFARARDRRRRDRDRPGRAPVLSRHLPAPARQRGRPAARGGDPVQWRLRMDEAQEEIGDVLIVRECPVDDRDVHFRDERPAPSSPAAGAMSCWSARTPRPAPPERRGGRRRAGVTHVRAAWTSCRDRHPRPAAGPARLPLTGLRPPWAGD